MRHMSSFAPVAASIAAVCLGSAAVSAADMAPRYTKAPAPMVMAYSWTGCYVGANGGWGWGDNHSAVAPSPDSVSQAFWNPAFIAGAAPSLLSYQNSGGVAGGQVGCNWQSGQFVFGGEADIDWANLKGSQTIATLVPPFVAGTFSSSSNLQWLGTVRGRIGWSPATADHWLFYATGGLAYGSVNYNTVYAFPATNDFQTLSSTNTQTGWTAGAGVEWAFNNNWTVRAEYLYVDLGNRTFTTVGTGRAANVATTLTDTFSNRYNIVRVGLNYKFGWGGPVVAKY
jgi:outer membrane immunogenic protein